MDKFHSQFVLSRTTYRDNNNFINVNKASSSDARYSITSDSNDYFFLNTELGPAWTSSSWVKPENTTDDKGVTWSTQADEIIFGAYFFLAEVRGVHTLSRYNTFSFLSQIGGLVNTLTLLFGVFMIVYNKQASATEVIKHMYFSPKPKISYTP